jgi:hypothetical protein
MEGTVTKICFILAVVDISGVFSLLPWWYCHHYHEIWIQPTSTTTNLGSQAQFNCYGAGTYLYWYINGVNHENISTEELNKLEITFGGYYNHYPPYMYGCDIQHSYLMINGNCFNNNTEIYCKILSLFYSPVSLPVNLTVQGIPSVVSNFKVYPADLTSVLLSWDIDPPPNENTTVILSVTDLLTNNTESINITGECTAYKYTNNNLTNLCNVFKFTLSPQYAYAGCNSTRTLTFSKNTASPPRFNITSVTNHFSYITIDLQFEVHECLEQFPISIQLLLNDVYDTQYTTRTIKLEGVYVISMNKTYTYKWMMDVTNHTRYQLNAITYNSFGNIVSNKFEFNTFNLQDLNIYRNGTDLCVRCILHLPSVMSGCIVHVGGSDNTLFYEAKKISNYEICFAGLNNGTYSIYGYDNEETLRPAVIKEYAVDWNIIEPIPSSTIMLNQSRTNNLTSSPVIHTSQGTSPGSNVSTQGSDVSTPVLGVLFGLSVTALFVFILAVLLLYCKQRISRNNDSNDDNNVNTLKVQQNTAYEMNYYENRQERVAAHDYQEPLPLPPRYVAAYENVQFN